MSVSLLRPTPSKPLQMAGIVALVTAAGHAVMGRSEIAPGIRRGDLAANTAYKGWQQGSFGYVIIGLNYLRLARIATDAFDLLDKLQLAASLGMHLFTIAGLPQPPPRILSAILIALVGGGLVS